MDTKGGRFTLDIGGKVFSGRGVAKIDSSTVEVKVETNQDGTTYRTVKAKPASLDLTFDRGVGFKWDTAMVLQTIKATFIEIDVNLMHLFTDAGWDGTPTIDTSTGEVSGLKIMTAQYKSTKAG